MIRSRAFFIDLLVAASIACLVLAASGIGHSAGTWYPHLWFSFDRQQNYGFANDVPSGNFRDRVEDGAQDWNALPGHMSFTRGGVNVSWGFNASCDNLLIGDNGIHWGNIDGPVQPGEGTSIWALARTECRIGGEIVSMQIKFDQDENWNTGTGGPGSNEVDALSVATHEFGHAVGHAYHWDENGAAGLCDFPDKHTMCSSINTGQSYQRGLEEHDRHTFNNAYP